MGGGAKGQAPTAYLSLNLPWQAHWETVTESASRGERDTAVKKGGGDRERHTHPLPPTQCTVTPNSIIEAFKS